MSIDTLDPITSAVRTLYERFPYPRYPLLAKPRWQEGYLASSAFSARLYAGLTNEVAAIYQQKSALSRPGQTILLAGAGEMQPYIIRKMEPSQHRLLCVDLSRSSLRRARFRLLPQLSPTAFIQSDLIQFLERQGAVMGPFEHIDVYGVLHHLRRPSQAIAQLYQHLAPHGTMRVMVYNRQARRWIHHLQNVFRQLGLDPYSSADRRIARSLLESLKTSIPVLAERMRAMGPTIRNDARLIDTFFHARETRIELEDWIGLIQEAGFRVLGMFDRYGELDDLNNPMWQMPSMKDLNPRANDRRFENNLELFVAKPGPKTKGHEAELQMPKWHFLKSPPAQWFSFPETSDIPWRLRWKLWHNHLRPSQNFCVDDLRKQLPFTALQRLARLGVVLPQQVKDPNLLAILMQPLTSKMEIPAQPARRDLSESGLVADIRALLSRKGRLTERRLAVILERLDRCQD